METKTVSSEIINFLKRYPKSWFFGGELERRLSNFHKPSTISRGLRLLTEGKPNEWKIYKDYEYVKGVSRPVVKYRYKV